MKCQIALLLLTVAVSSTVATFLASHSPTVLGSRYGSYLYKPSHIYSHQKYVSSPGYQRYNYYRRVEYPYHGLYGYSYYGYPYLTSYYGQRYYGLGLRGSVHYRYPYIVGYPQPLHI